MAKWDLSIYLIKRLNEKKELIIKPTLSIVPHAITLETGEQWNVYVKNVFANPPPWAKFFRDHVQDTGIFGKSSSPAAVLTVPAADRLFALVFGTSARSLLYADSWEDRFGFRVTINAVDHERLWSVDKDRLEAEPRRGREQTTRDRNASYFGVDPSRDIVQSVVGTPRDLTLGGKLTGKDHLRAMKVPITLPELPLLLERYYSHYQSTSYQKHFSWIDHIAQVTDKETIGLLDLELVDMLNKRDLDTCFLAVPEVVEWERIDGFKYSHFSPQFLHSELSLDQFLETFKIAINLDDLRRRHVRAEDVDGRNIYDWPAYRCLIVEVDNKDETYLLNAGTWFKVATDFVASVNEFFSNVPTVDKTYLHEYRSIDTSEGDYNKRTAMASQGQLALMDTRNIICPTATSPIEFCDLYHKTKEIVHVKRYGGSSVLSHLFFQGLNSAEAFLKDSGFREELNKKLPTTHQLPNPHDEITPEDYTVLFAIVTGRSGPLTLPFFSRLSLRHVVEQLQLYRFKVALTKVSMTEKAIILSKKSKKSTAKTC